MFSQVAFKLTVADFTPPVAYTHNLDMYVIFVFIFMAIVSAESARAARSGR